MELPCLWQNAARLPAPATAAAACPSVPALLSPFGDRPKPLLSAACSDWPPRQRPGRLRRDFNARASPAHTEPVYGQPRGTRGESKALLWSRVLFAKGHVLASSQRETQKQHERPAGRPRTRGRPCVHGGERLMAVSVHAIRRNRQSAKDRSHSESTDVTGASQRRSLRKND